MQSVHHMEIKLSSYLSGSTLARPIARLTIRRRHDLAAGLGIPGPLLGAGTLAARIGIVAPRRRRLRRSLVRSCPILLTLCYSHQRRSQKDNRKGQLFNLHLFRHTLISCYGTNGPKNGQFLIVWAA